MFILFNKWKKCNVRVPTGKCLFAELEKSVAVYNEEYNDIGRKVFIQRYSKCSGKEEPLILAVCTSCREYIGIYNAIKITSIYACIFLILKT